MSEKYFIVCYNRDEYKEFVKRKWEELYNAGSTSISFSDFVYVAGPYILRGYRNPRGWLYGRWKEREDIEHILITLSTCHDNNNSVIARELYNLRVGKSV